MAIVLYNDWYITENPGNSSALGSSDVRSKQPSEYQTYNANKVYQYLSNIGFTKNAIAGIVGCMMTESFICPTAIETKTYTSPPSNETMNSYTKGIGLVQWTSSGAPPQKLVNFCINYGRIWYDGDAQMFRIQREYETDIQFNKWTIDGTYWTWEIFKNSTASPDVLAKAWDYCYEVSSHTALAARQANALYWYDNFGPVKGKFPIWLLLEESNKRRLRR